MKAILIDDENLALTTLEHQLTGITDLQIVGKFTDPFLGKAAVAKGDIDLVFLDIHIPEINGIELAERLLECKPELNIIFVTAYDDFAIRAFELNALDYVLKPVRKERLLKTVQRIKQRINDTTDPTLQNTEVLKMTMFQQVLISNGRQPKMKLPWRTKKVQQLFLYLVHRRGQNVSKSEIIDLLWQEFDPKKAYAQLYTAVYHIRKTLEPIGRHFIIINTSEGYLLTLEDTILDVDEFDSFIQSGLSLSTDTIGAYEQAISLFKGDYLQNLDYVWAESERQRQALFWVDTSLRMVNWYRSNSDFGKAIELGMNICNRYPMVEEAYLSLMKSFDEIGNNPAVHYHYYRLKEVLTEELCLEPSPSITEWFTNWKKKNKE